MIPHTTPPPTYPKNACLIFKQYPRWYWDMRHAKQHWGIPISVQLAMIQQESGFQALAKTRHSRLWSIPLPFSYISSAMGYAQAIDSTWHQYQIASQNYLATRTSLRDAVDFIGWFEKNAVHKAHIDPHHAYALYLAYHEGILGYLHQSYRKKPWLIAIAYHVQKQTSQYHRELIACQSYLPQDHSWNYW